MAEKKYTRIVVEENNEHGFDSYRVPGIVTASNGVSKTVQCEPDHSSACSG